MFKQKIKDGYQEERPDNWLKNGNPFELRRPEYAKEVRFGGNIRVEYDDKTGDIRFKQENYESVLAVPYDYPIVGYDNHIVNTLRIWDAEPIVDFQLDSFDRGDYHKAVEQQNLAKTIVEVLYPNDNHYAGKELRLKQQYFFVSASLQAALTKYKKHHDDIHKLPQQRPVLTRTTPSWQRLWKNGQSICFPGCFLVYTRSSRRLTAALWPRSVRCIREMKRK